MTVDLSSFGRTRRKIFFFTLILCLCLIISPPGGEFTHYSPPLSPTPVLASEEETVDSFLVHPAQRWPTFSTGGGIGNVIDKGIFKVTATGLGDWLDMRRPFSKADSRIEVRFKFDSNGLMDDTSDRFWFRLYGTNTNNYFQFKVSDFNNSDYVTTEIEFSSIVGGGNKNKTLSGNERLFDNEWYILKIKYDLQESEMRFQCYFENKTKVFDYDWYELRPGEGYNPSLFGELQINLNVYINAFTTNTTILYIDYINAPFKGRNWEQTIVGSDSDWLSETPLGILAQDDIDDDSEWEIVVPKLDVVSGTMFHSGGNFATGGDRAYFSIVLYGVDGDDGDAHKIAEVRLHKQYTPPSGVNFSIIDGDNNLVDSYTHGTIAYTPRADFSISLLEDRSVVEIIGRCWQDHSNEDNFGDVFASIDVSDHVDDPSIEFILRTYYYSDFTSDIELVMRFEEFGWLEKNIFDDIGRAIGNLISGVFEFIFIGLFRFLAIIFKVVGDLIVAAVDALAPLINAVKGVLDSLYTTITEIAGWAAGVLTDIYNEFAKLGSYIWEYIESVVSDFAAWLQDVLDIVIPTLISFLGTIISLIVGLIADIVFWIWDELNLPDILSWIGFALDYFGEFVTWALTTTQDLVAFLQDFAWLLLVGWWIYAVLIQWARARFDPLGGVGNFIDAYFKSIIPIEIFGNKIIFPQGIVFTLWLIVILPADFALFTAMSS